MKHMVKMAFIVVLLLTACNITPGATGPQGPAGPIGNANVQEYTFPERTFPRETEYIVPGISYEQVESSLIFSYFFQGSTWIPVPGLTPNGIFETRVYFNSGANFLRYTVRVQLSDGFTQTDSFTFDKFKIIIVPASNVTKLNAAGINYNDYNAVRKYFNLPKSPAYSRSSSLDSTQARAFFWLVSRETAQQRLNRCRRHESQEMYEQRLE
jgi:hypothetical protein